MKKREVTSWPWSAILVAMSALIYSLLLIFILILRMPLAFFFIIFKNLLGPLSKRIDFERKNLLSEEGLSFAVFGLTADYCFEVSSEGELEQIRPLLEFYLSRNHKIEILFSSPSVEMKCLKLASDYKDQIRVLRLPLVSFFPFPFLYFQSVWFWVTAPTILFCRYDFFPELLLFKWFNKKLILLSASCKNPTWFKKRTYNYFRFILAANKNEEAFFKEAYPHILVSSFDFRIPQIFKRLKGAPLKLNSEPLLASYLQVLKSAPSKLILGSSWPSDLVIFENENWQQEILENKIHVLIVPHSLKPESLKAQKDILKKLMPKVPLYEISTNENFSGEHFIKNPGIVILNLSGYLCELYSLFSFAYIGGGYERSIHSLLEPFLSGCQVATGPKIHRSTEYDFVKLEAPEEMIVLGEKAQNFLSIFKERYKRVPDKKIREKLEEEAGPKVLELALEIELC